AFTTRAMPFDPGAVSRLFAPRSARLARWAQPPAFARGTLRLRPVRIGAVACLAPPHGRCRLERGLRPVLPGIAGYPHGISALGSPEAATAPAPPANDRTPR